MVTSINWLILVPSIQQLILAAFGYWLGVGGGGGGGGGGEEFKSVITILFLPSERRLQFLVNTPF